jgi:hypothetical protein
VRTQVIVEISLALDLGINRDPEESPIWGINLTAVAVHAARRTSLLPKMMRTTAAFLSLGKNLIDAIDEPGYWLRTRVNDSLSACTPTRLIRRARGVSGSVVGNC